MPLTSSLETPKLIILRPTEFFPNFLGARGAFYSELTDLYLLCLKLVLVGHTFCKYL